MSKEELFDKYLTDSLSENEELEFLELMKDEEVGKEFVEYSMQIHAYSETADKILTHELNGEWQSPKPINFKLISVVVAAAALLALIFILPKSNAETITASSEVTVIRNGKAQKSKGVLIGDLVKCETLSDLKFSDGSKVSLQGELLIENLDSNKEMFLKSGKVNVKVTPQKSGIFKVKTENCTVEVIGTAFDITKGQSQTSIQVNSGKVRFSNGKSEVILTKGDSAIAENGEIRSFTQSAKVRYTQKYLYDPDLKFHMDFEGDTPLKVKGNFAAEGKLLKGDFTEGMKPGSKALSPKGIIEIPFSHKFSAEVPITINALVKKFSASTYAPIFTKGDTSWRLQLDDKGKKFHAAFGYHHGHDYLDSKGEVTVNKWHLLTAVYIKNHVKVYIDGKFDSELTTDKMHLNNHHYIRIGSNTEYKGRSFDGLIDEVSFFTRELSSDEIEELYKLLFDK